MSKASEVVRALIKENNVMVFSKSYCPYCRKVKDLFSSLNVPFHAIELDQDAQGSAIQEELRQMTKQSTVPNVFVKGKHVGGCDDTHEAHQSGKLKQMLAA